MEITETGLSGGRQPVTRLLAEAVVVVFSILLAFAIDAWWDDRGDRQAELLLLQRIRADFTEIRGMLEVTNADHLLAHEACLSLLDFAPGATLPHTPDSDVMVARVFTASRTFNPGTGAIETFLNSDGARLVRNQRLADMLLTWSGLVEELQEEEASLQKGVSERWTPFLAGRVSLGPYVASWGEITSGIPETVARPSQRTELTVDQDFVNQVLDRYLWQQLALRDIEPLLAAVDKILALLDEELEN